MEFEAVLASLEERLQSCDFDLSPAERLVLKGCWEGKTYPVIAKEIDYAETTVKNATGPELLKKLSKALGRKITKKTLTATLKDCLNLGQDQTQPLPNSVTEIEDDDFPDFVGRRDDFAALDRYRSRGTKAVLIWGEGGIGKTQLAFHYLENKFGSKILDFRLTRDQRMATSIEYQMQAKLRDDLQEEPGQEFEVSLERFKKKLRDESWGIWIDNLEPLLDKQGKFLEEHWKYKVFLEQVACDPRTQSFGLITSRELLCEGLDLETYQLKSLSMGDWSEYFNIFENQSEAYKVLSEMHRYFGGNALAMKNIRQSVSEYRNTGLIGYWKDYPYQDRSDSRENVKDLIRHQFNRLKKRNTHAYNLLCRTGCFRYQEVPAVPHEALIAMLWDVEENNRRFIVSILKSSGLIEVEDGEFSLHPYIHNEAKSRLLNMYQAWEKANIEAASFWSSDTREIVNTEKANKALESYHHYLEVNEKENAGEIITKRRKGIGDNTRSETLGGALYRLGLTAKCINLVENIFLDIKSSFLISKLANILGDCYWLTGELKRAVFMHENSKNHAMFCLESKEFCSSNKEEIRLQRLIKYSLFNIGLCKIDYYELDDAKQYFYANLKNARNILVLQEAKKSKVISNDRIQLRTISNYIEEAKKEFLESVVACNTLLAMILANQGQFEDAVTCIKKASLGFISPIYSPSAWGRGYIPIFMGIAYNLVGFKEQALSCFEKAIIYADGSAFLQAKAKALLALAEIHREKKDISLAFKCYSKSIELCNKTSARCDLAEVYLQQGITCKEIGKYDQAACSFAEAEKIWKAIDAPKQLERLELIRKG